MEAISLCLLLNKPHLFSLTQVYFNSVYCPGKYATRFGLYSEHTLDMSIQKHYKAFDTLRAELFYCL